ncbi:HNH endonuclease [Hibiscus syriacus]|uniref:HNH endonuclease n=1 Tax=Hibiscus syriacus TaxID=106335 RepID=A0A6A2YXL7_HIBSY|nr:GATA transcription factor 5-like [Hibiscus syriacus]KAE8684156.1 HNH endonuclease [Hibiscus syriacus]
MDFLRNVSVSGENQAPTTSIDDLFSTQNTEVDVSLEWLSIFVEDCFSSIGNCIPVFETKPPTAPPPTAAKSSKKPHQITPPSLQKFAVPCKARSKRKRVSSSASTTILFKTKNNPFFDWSCSLQLANHDPLLLQQPCWLADSELIVPKKEDDNNSSSTMKEGITEEEKPSAAAERGQQQQGRRCSHCLAQRTPQWRAGPMGPKTLCNACGVRYKSGRLLPEYRPAKSPTFVSYLHSNSHKKVMEMRMSISSDQ